MIFLYENFSNVPILTLVGFALWTILLLMFTVGLFRLIKIFQGKVHHPSAFRPCYTDQWGDFYYRAMRAHMNCVENLPVYAALIFALYALNIQSNWINFLCISFLIFRILQSLVHVGFKESRITIILRFSLFCLQIIIDIILAMMIIF